MGKHPRTIHRQQRRESTDVFDPSPHSTDTDHGLGHDLLNDAKIWSMYVEEATGYDKALLKGWNDALDVLLILAGLFSAVLTAFLIESYKLLQPDYQESTTALLLRVVQRLDDAFPENDGVPLFQFPPDWPPLPSRPFNPPASAWWLNVLWFSSLACSLSAAFVAMLAKQWLHAYTLEVDHPGRTERHARQRHFRHSGLRAWKVSEIISTLPVLLQSGFALFFVGLDVLLWPINRPIAYLMILLTSILLGFYAITTMAPFFDAACPFKTPFSLALRTQARWVYLQGYALVKYAYAAVRFRTLSPSVLVNGNTASNMDIEQIKINQAHHELNVGIIQWLVSTSQKYEVVDTALMAISSLRPDFNATPKLRDSGAIQLLVDRLNPPQIQLENPSGAAIAFRRHAANSVPYLASMLCSLRHCLQSDIAHIANRFHWRAWIVSWGDFTLEQLISDGWDLDALALYLCASTQCDRAEGRRANREFNILLKLLDRHSSGKAEMRSFAVWALVDTIALWGAEFGDVSMQGTRSTVVACLLRLLGSPYKMGDPVTRAIGVALGVFALDFHQEEVAHYHDEEKRRDDAHVLLIRGVTDIMKEPPGSASRYELDKETFEAGGMVICQLLIENNLSSWPSGVPAALVAILSYSTSETLTCRVLETFRRLLSFDSHSAIPYMSSSIIPLLEISGPQSVKIKATQVLGEMMHWRVHRKAILDKSGVQNLLHNLNSSCGDLSNASSLALIGLAKDPHARDIMVDLGLVEALTTFFKSNNASIQNIAYWSWSFVGSAWAEARDGNDRANEFGKAFRQLSLVLEQSMRTEGGLADDITRTPVRRREMQRILQRLKQLSETCEKEDK